MIIKKYLHVILTAAFACIIIFSGIMIFKKSGSEVVINEVCTSNVACCEGADGNYPDWVELYNPTEETIDLSGYVLSKSGDLKKEKFEFPSGAVIGPGSYYLLDPGFTMSSKGTMLNLADRRAYYIDHVDIPQLEYDTVYARTDDASPVWDVKNPTPGYSNSEGESVAGIIAGEVKASVASGFYEEPFELKLKSSSFMRKIYYTTDGRDPKEYGILYDEPIRVSDRSSADNVYSMIPEVSKSYVDGETALPSFKLDKCTVVKAVSCDLIGRYTEISTFTYFVGFDKKTAYDNIAVVSVSADPKDLFSYEDGIMVLGKDYDEFVAAGEPEEYDASKANFTRRGRSSERKISLDIFDENHNPVLSTGAGIRIKGLSSRWDVQKSFSVFFRKAYGGEHKQSFIAEGINYDVHSFALDKCGQDTGTKMVDTIMSECMSDSGCATARRIPCCLFLNGEYWGLYWIADRFDNDYFADKYGVLKDEVEVIDSDDEYFDSHGWEIDDFDRTSLIEYYAANIIVSHDGDWPQYNVRFWKTSSENGEGYADGKLRPVIFDMNSRSMISPEYDVIDFIMNWYPFKNLSENEDGFREELVAEIDRMSKNEFETGKVLSLIDGLYNKMREQMILDQMRYTNCDRRKAAESFDKDVDVLRSFYRNRQSYLERYKEAYLNGK